MSGSAGLAASLVSQLLLAKELDTLHLSLVNLRDLAEAGEIDLVLDQPKKTPDQKKAALEGMLKELPSLPLRKVILEALKKDGLELFIRQNLLDTLDILRQTAEGVQVVRLTVAVEFKEKELKGFANELCAKLNKPVVLELAVQRELIGGVVVQYGSYISDYSLRSRMQQFREHWQSAANPVTPTA